MSEVLELSDSRVSHIEWLAGMVRVHFSQASLHKSTGKSGRAPPTAWSLVMLEAVVTGPLPPTIAEGFLEVGGIRHELFPLPFRRKVGARLRLQFADGAVTEIAGTRPFIELLGTPIFLKHS